jgi:hypothetical protein
MMRVYPEVRAIAPNCPEEKENFHGDSGLSEDYFSRLARL